MKKRIWAELCQVKFNQYYSVKLLVLQKQYLNYFNLGILLFSSAGFMGWKIWNDFPVVSCVIISAISVVKLLGNHLVPSEKQIDKLDRVSDFYTDYYNSLEQLWFDYYNEVISDQEAQQLFYNIKSTEKDINKIVKEVIKGKNKKLRINAENECQQYLSNTF